MTRLPGIYAARKNEYDRQMLVIRVLWNGSSNLKIVYDVIKLFTKIL